MSFGKSMYIFSRSTLRTFCSACKCQGPSLLEYFGGQLCVICSAGLTIVANVAIATGPAVFCNKSYLLHYIYKIVQSKKSRSQYFAKFAISSKRRFSIERCLCPEILV